MAGKKICSQEQVQQQMTREQIDQRADQPEAE